MVLYKRKVGNPLTSASNRRNDGARTVSILSICAQRGCHIRDEPATWRQESSPVKAILATSRFVRNEKIWWYMSGPIAKRELHKSPGTAPSIPHKSGKSSHRRLYLAPLKIILAKRATPVELYSYMYLEGPLSNFCHVALRTAGRLLVMTR